MAISMYNLDTKTWANTNPVSSSPGAALQWILVNIYIEMRVQTMYAEATNRGIVITDDPQALRVDVTQDFPVNG